MTQHQRSDLRYVQVVASREAVAVALTTTVILAPLNMRGFDECVLYVDNDGANQFDGAVEVSPDGVFPGCVMPDDAFEAMSAGETRWTRVPAAAQWVRVTGTFATTPANVRISAFLQRGGSKPG